ncbi:putative 5-proFAR isomerase His6 [Aureobasidium subglaciale]|nr:putative 5-proFAR isomerase His6 [Aureobasidium subglaciale]KAI5222456.1 putative 5-proFAR isomerase His6 [Aureobasidium subglaciale]KAI5223277.1 putative 5-proFAR isomerase His6 [Aureobasidium subglaciale]KAI5259905.1 putative 5-proFAR isomerase His6 [Aureobasidium subglaciale]
MTKFRPCIDLHAGSVKQIVGGTLTTTTSELKTNFTSKLPSSYYAKLYKENALEGAHVIMLGPGNDDACKEACEAWPGHLQVGGGIKDENAKEWIEKGASKRQEPVRECSKSKDLGESDMEDDYVLSTIYKVIITSFLFPFGKLSLDRLQSVLKALDNDTSKLVIDLSCRRKGDTWFVAMNKWQDLTDMELTAESISLLQPYCSEFLIHAADNEGLQQGIDEELVRKLSEWSSIPVTYAGGGRNLQDLELVESLSGGKVDLTIGSALDVFGGNGVKFDECCEWNSSRT